MIRKKKMFERPRKAYVKSRIDEENKLVEKYGLKNKREIWKTLAKINYFRTRAKSLAKLPLEEQEILFKKLKMIGLKTDTIADVLALNVEALLERRLPTVMARKGLANTPRQARQMVVHKRVLVDKNVINIPSYLVPVSQENLITLKNKVKVPKAESKKEEVMEEVQNG